jgi:hypothetical protein
MKNNRLTTISDTSMFDLTAIEEFYVDGNLITSLPPDVFARMAKLRIL